MRATSPKKRGAAKRPGWLSVITVPRPTRPQTDCTVDAGLTKPLLLFLLFPLCPIRSDLRPQNSGLDIAIQHPAVLVAKDVELHLRRVVSQLATGADGPAGHDVLHVVVGKLVSVLE